MSTELMYLTWVTALTALMWIPYILNMIMVARTHRRSRIS